MHRLALLDYGRFIAALSVVFFHYFYNGITNGKISTLEHTWFADIASYGHFGVQFFFIISGYVIFFSLKDKGAAAFLKSRLKRLYPTYWFAIIFTAFFIYLWGADTSITVTTKQILVNFTMLQNFVGVSDVDGVYWTLFYEIIFYGLVFAILLFGNFKKLLAFLVAWPFLIIACSLIGKTFLIFNMYFIFFVIGAMFALIKNGNISRKVALFVLIVSSMVGFYHTYALSVQKEHNLFVVASIYSAILIFFTVLNVDRYREINLPFAKDLGGMTYPLYLIHAYFGYLFLSQFADPSNAWVIYPLLISWLLWYTIEVKQANFWHKFFSMTVKPIEKLEAKLG